MIALLRAVPLLWKLGIVAGLIVAGWGAVAVWKHSIYQEGVADANREANERNQNAADDVRAAVSKPRACRGDGGRWDVARGVCIEPD